MSDLMSKLVSEATIAGADEFRQRFRSAKPFRHLAIDGFFTDRTASQLLEAFPAFDEKLAMNENGEVGGKAVNEQVRKLGPVYRELDDLVQSEEFRALVSRMTGIPNLQYDPHYFGGGTHENLHGQALDAHVDFNFHPITRQHRRLNMIFYLTEDWQDEWGGSIQLHRDPYLTPAEDDIVTVTPLFNRCVIFETNEYSWHGFPRIELPEDKRHLSRKSFALYYYTDTRPAEELGPEHSTIYVERHLPEDWHPDMVLRGDQLQHMRNLLTSRDHHLRRLYGNIKQLYTELNHLKEAQGVQAPPGVAPEPEEWKSSASKSGSGGRGPGPVSTRETRAGDEGAPAVVNEAPAPEPVEAAAGPTPDEAAAQARAEELSREQARLEAELEQRIAELSRRQATVQRLEARVRELEGSTSWRVTRPMRQLKRLLRGG
jgi:hypothetical protein